MRSWGRIKLAFVYDYLCRRFAHLKLRAHFLDLSGLLFELRYQSFHSLLLLRDGRFQVLHLLVLFKELVEQHYADLLEPHGLDVTVVVMEDEVGSHLSHLLGD